MTAWRARQRKVEKGSTISAVYKAVSEAVKRAPSLHSCQTPQLGQHVKILSTQRPLLHCFTASLRHLLWKKCWFVMSRSCFHASDVWVTHLKSENGVTRDLLPPSKLNSPSNGAVCLTCHTCFSNSTPYKWPRLHILPYRHQFLHRVGTKRSTAATESPIGGKLPDELLRNLTTQKLDMGTLFSHSEKCSLYLGDCLSLPWSLVLAGN